MATDQLASAKFQRPQLRLGGLPVFLYHGFSASSGVEIHPRKRKYWISEIQFRGHLEQIRRGGYHVVPLREAWSDDGALLARNSPLVLTFDDGWASDYQVVYPLLLDAGVRADFFVNTATIGEQGFLSWQQIVEMQRTGMSFQSHSHDHVDLVRLPARLLEQQLRDSKRGLEDRLGCSVDFLAVPYGLLNSRVVEVARQEGYRAVCTSWSWPAWPGVRTVNRVPIYRHTTSREFSQLLAGNPVFYLARVTRWALAYMPKRLLLRFRPDQLTVCVLEEQA